MTDMDTLSDLTHLLTQQPSIIQQRVRNAQSGNLPLPSSFNWLGLAEIAAQYARIGLDTTWLDIALTAYAVLEEQTNTARACSDTLSAMNLRAYFILHGMVTHPLLNPNDIIEWFLASLPISITEAAIRVDHWQHIPVYQVRELRCIKNQLSIIKMLVHLPAMNTYPEVHFWIALWDKLP